MLHKRQIENVLYAGVVGDALGVPVEFSKRDSYYIDSMTAGGTWEQAKGSWSDDTSFTLPLMESLTEDGSYEELMQKFENYMFHNEYTPDNLAFGIGSACAKAFRNWSVNHYPALECGDPSVEANGNGALMRLAPLAIHLVDESDLNKRLQLAYEYTCLTHRHPRAIVGSYIYLEILHGLLNGRALRAILNYLPEQLHQALRNRPDELAELPQYDEMFKNNFGMTLRKDIKSSGYVVDTLLASTWSVLASTSIDKAIILAANLGDDTDTIASITATISSCENLNDHVSDQWRSQLQNPELLNKIIDRFAEKEASRALV